MTSGQDRSSPAPIAEADIAELAETAVAPMWKLARQLDQGAELPRTPRVALALQQLSAACRGLNEAILMRTLDARPRPRIDAMPAPVPVASGMHRAVGPQKSRVMGVLGSRTLVSGTSDGAEQPRLPTLQGTSRSLSITAAFSMLSANRKSGSLEVTLPEEVITFEFFEGDVICSSTDKPRPDELLGAVLVRKGILTEERLRQFLDGYPKYRAIGSALEEYGLATPEQLKEALGELLIQRFQRVFDADNASFGFFEGQPASADELLRVNVRHLLLETARMADEKGRGGWAAVP